MAPVLVIPVFIPHEGCSHRCIFCNQHLITSQADPDSSGLPDRADLDQVINTYLPYRGRRSRVELAFFGGNFLGLPECRILELLNAATPYLEKGLIHGIRCSTRPDTVRRRVLEKVVPLGLTLVELGVQSMDNEVLMRARRGHTREDTIRAVEVLKEADTGVGVQLMAGLPGDTADKALATARTVADLSPDLARIYPVLVLSGSPLAAWYRQGRYAPLTLPDAVSQVKEMVTVLEGKGVPVIRMGLQASDTLADDARMLAGPWHPAFGHLVRSALMLERVSGLVRKLLDKDSGRNADKRDGQKTDRIRITVHPRAESRLRGDKNLNLAALGQQFPGLAFEIGIDADLDRDAVLLKALP